MRLVHAALAQLDAGALSAMAIARWRDGVHNLSLRLARRRLLLMHLLDATATQIAARSLTLQSLHDLPPTREAAAFHTGLRRWEEHRGEDAGHGQPPAASVLSSLADIANAARTLVSRDGGGASAAAGDGESAAAGAGCGRVNVTRAVQTAFGASCHVVFDAAEDLATSAATADANATILVPATWQRVVGCAFLASVPSDGLSECTGSGGPPDTSTLFHSVALAVAVALVTAS
jgi:hypothetical protein